MAGQQMAVGRGAVSQWRALAAAGGAMCSVGGVKRESQDGWTLGCEAMLLGVAT
jgi:hypothetical protein